MSPLAREVLIEAVALPLGVAAFLTLATRLVPPRHRACMAGLGLVVAFAAAFVLIRDWPGLPPRSATEKLLPIALLALVLAAAHAHWRLRRWPPWLVQAIVCGLIPVWLATPRLDDAPTPFLVQAAALWLAGLAGGAGVQAAGGRPLRSVAMLGACALGLAGVALFARSVSLAELALALAAALLGLLLASRLAGQRRLTGCILLPATSLLLALAAILAMFSEAAPWLVAIAWLPLFADPLGRRIVRSRRRERFAFALLAAGPPALATLLALAVAGPLQNL